MPEDDVSDLRDVVDAINKLCETMKTSYDEYEDCEDTENVHIERNTIVEDVLAEYWSEIEDVTPLQTIEEPVPRNVETCTDTSYTVVEPDLSPEIVAEPVIFKTCKSDKIMDSGANVVVLAPEQVTSVSRNVESYSDSWDEPSETTVVPVTSPCEPIFEKVKSYKSEKCDAMEPQKQVAVKTDAEMFRSIVADRFEETEPFTSDVETVQCEPVSEMYYTASSEVSLLSDVDFQEKVQPEDSDREKDDRTGVMAGHVAAMRERFESMTRTNTPCPDLMRSTSPSFEVFRNLSASPDILD